MGHYEVILSSRYRTALKSCRRHKNFNQEILEEVIRTLASNLELNKKYKDHALTGNFKEYRECHIQNDLLLVYQKHDNVLVLLLIDIGSHAKLFK